MAQGEVAAEGTSSSWWTAALLFAAALVTVTAAWCRTSAQVPTQNPFRTASSSRFGPPPSPRRHRIQRPGEAPQSDLKALPAAGCQPGPAPISASLNAGESFIYAAAHDLQEPLRKLRTSLGRLESHTGPAQPQDTAGELDTMRKTLARMQALLDSLLSLAGIQGRGAVFQRVQLQDVIRDVMADLEPRILESRAEISVEGSLPPLDADPVQLRQLLQNLVGNAIKFQSREHRPRVQIQVTVDPATDPEAARTAASAAGWCQIGIRDNGIGFDTSEWTRMLQGFHRQQSRDRFEGTGLGLAICRSIVERHLGTLEAFSRPGEGTSMVLRLPLNHHARGGDTTVVPRSACIQPPPTIKEP